MSIQIVVRKKETKELQEKELEKALKFLKKKTALDFKEMRDRKYFSKPSLIEHLKKLERKHLKERKKFLKRRK